MIQKFKSKESPFDVHLKGNSFAEKVDSCECNDWMLRILTLAYVFYHHHILKNSALRGYSTNKIKLWTVSMKSDATILLRITFRGK